MTPTLQGQTALVTGAGSAVGIGFAIAQRLLAAGAKIAITSTTERIHARAVALETARDGITINAVAPGWIETASSTETERIAGRHTPSAVRVSQAKWPQQSASWPRRKPPISPGR